MMDKTESASSNSERHRIYFRQPQRVPPFDTAFVRASDTTSLKLLLSAAPEHCQIILFTDGTGTAYAMKRLFKRKFLLNSQALQLDLPTITLTGQVVYQFVRGGSVRDKLSRYFCAGPSYLHELAQTSVESDVLDMFCLGLDFHTVLRARERGRSIVFTEE
ncbi:hypothetical protein pEaSNUABM46_00010 [Erwinia phage pEa_SNUABM_46]|nr:hypothetical protein pEaSNUABM46_00010 [Erwinia phage pEa_SNUABM_46]QYW05024.1 hypothetical protein pEaSNUABM21_00010 [Erwinia phage pEa_SNUABM_21]